MGPSSDVSMLQYMDDNADKHFWQEVGATAGGTAAGGLLGALAIKPLAYRERVKAEQAAAERRAVFDRNKEILKTLNDLHQGKLSWEDINPEAKLPLEQMYAEHKPLLDDRRAMQEALRKLPPAEVIRMPGVPKVRLAQLLPDAEMLRHPMQTFSHPIPATLGLLGGGLAGYAMNDIHRKRLIEMLKKQQAEGGTSDA